jgi:hypothetical protein
MHSRRILTLAIGMAAAAVAFIAAGGAVARAQTSLKAHVTEKTQKVLKANPKYGDFGMLQLTDDYEYWEFDCAVGRPGGPCVGERTIQLPRSGPFVLVAGIEGETATDGIAVAVYAGSSDDRPLAEKNDPAWNGNGLEFAVNSMRAAVKVTVGAETKQGRRIGIAVISLAS